MSRPGVRPPVRGRTVIAFALMKGGSGKSTSCVSIAAILAHGARRPPLVVDMDPQVNASRGLGYDPPPDAVTVYDLLLGTATADQAIVEVEIPPSTGARHAAPEVVHLIPGSRSLAAAENSLMAAFDRVERLDTALQQIRGDYDAILIDSSPLESLMLGNALAAADGVVACIRPMVYEIDAIGTLADYIEQINMALRRRHGQPDIAMVGVLPTQVPGSGKAFADGVALVEDIYPGLLLPGVPHSVRVAEAAGAGRPVPSWDPRGNATAAYVAAAAEVQKRGWLTGA